MSSAIDGTGAAQVLQAAADHLTHLDDTGQRTARRQRRIKTEIQARMEQKLVAMTEKVLASEVGGQVLAEAEQGKLPPTRASSTLLDQLLRSSDSVI